ncbi:hypothetical protein BX286_6867 [Streptomyces sp. 3211.6]|uniref:hypothetical protein n=1 Tax=unclassified Streptomyces TaxID=2593676 RepID=UPI000F159313|nr:MULTISPECIES: hypothetical protein [unclassified Streptomyces]RKS97057.1 hypothetical protein BX286_6867 [Streptomyces sp. 3211.6]RPF25420.1 hypothetical protein EDD96_6941 [Streptomyces sp. Ag109_G2-6]
MSEKQNVTARQRGWAVAGVVAAVLGAGFWIAVTHGFLFWIAMGTGAVTLVPLLTVDRPKAFARACLAVGSALLAWSLIGVVLGMFVFLPAAVLLLVAAFVEPGNRPRAGFAAAVPLVVAAAAAVLAR